jgi:hypothetical protein
LVEKNEDQRKKSTQREKELLSQLHFQNLFSSQPKDVSFDNSILDASAIEEITA